MQADTKLEAEALLLETYYKCEGDDSQIDKEFLGHSIRPLTYDIYKLKGIAKKKGQHPVSLKAMKKICAISLYAKILSRASKAA